MKENSSQDRESGEILSGSTFTRSIAGNQISEVKGKHYLFYIKMKVLMLNFNYLKSRLIIEPES